MFNREESRLLRELFWTSFGKSFPHKWTMHHTKIKGLAFKFHADRKTAMVCLDVDIENELDRMLQWDKLESVKAILENDFLPNVIYDNDYYLEEGHKTICRIYVNYEQKFSIHNKNTWRDCFEFFVAKMEKFEAFFEDYKDFITVTDEEKN